MSCYIVGKTHIDALVEAGLSGGQWRGNLTWFAREITTDDRIKCEHRGEVWSEEGLALAQSLRRELTHETADRVGQMLMHENRLSVDYRYAESELEEIYTFGLWTQRAGTVNPVVILKAIAGYEYQSCEHPGWPESEAHAFCEALKDKMINALPGYEDGPGWEITDRAQYTQNIPQSPRTYTQGVARWKR